MIKKLLVLLCILMASPALAIDAPAKPAEIAQLQKKLVELASQMRTGEQKLANLSIKQNKLDAKITDARIKLDASRDEIDALLQSLVKLSRTPPEAVVAMPGELRQTIKAAQLMSYLTARMQQKTGELTQRIKTLQKDELDLAETREKLKQEQSRLQASRLAMEEKLAQRKLAYENDNQEYQRKLAEAEKAKAEALNVAQLEAKLQEKKAAEKAKEAQATKTEKPVQVAKALPLRGGRMRLPVAGQVTARYGQRVGTDQTSHGYHLASAAGATVISPLSGEVMFTGPFLDYGNIVIVKFDNGYHMLVAGLGRIDCSVGQKVAGGEPLGRVNSSADVYLELRRNGKAIDPTPWFG